MNKININNFDFLRVVFAFTVAFAHLIELSDLEILKPFKVFFNTRLAIDGFFIVSGFLIAKSYENSTTIKDYIIRRAKRIIPAYAVVILISALFLSAISTYSLSEYFSNIQFWKYLTANLSFQNYLEPCLPGVFETNKFCAVNGALWTIKLEEAFYLLVPVFYWLVRVKKFNFYALIIIVYLLSVTYYTYFLSIDNYRIAKQLPGALAFFGTGIVFYKNFSLLQKWKDYIIIPCLIIFFLEHYILKTQLLKPVAFGFMVFYVAYSFRFLNNFGKYGDFTYGIYIYHFPLIQLFVYLGLFNKYPPILICMLFLMLTLLLAILSWYLIEIPYLSKNRRLRQKKLWS
ncbi:MAG: acyltransferase [Flavobacteriaceae bacterium]|nr:acyltransferase [Flavobacteriaceae bacterium]MDA7849242.1 acyltransferase [Flavobacteriaceae bacterium]MDG1309516.1 acyltransferase [Flavobacteriaceae bacterium]